MAKELKTPVEVYLKVKQPGCPGCKKPASYVKEWIPVWRCLEMEPDGKRFMMLGEYLEKETSGNLALNGGLVLLACTDCPIEWTSELDRT